MWCKKYSDIYKEIAKLNPKDTLQLVLESETEEEKDFYEMVWDFLLQRRQKEVMIIFQDNEISKSEIGGGNYVRNIKSEVSG